MNHALKIVIEELKKSHFWILNRVNPIYKNNIVANRVLIDKYLNTGNIDPKIEDFLNKLYYDCYSVKMMYSCDAKNTDFLNPYSKSFDFRFYFNMPINWETILFCRDYQILCQKFGVPFTMKEFKNINMLSKDKDITIFYATVEDLPIKISIMKELVKKYPNMKLGPPPIACASIKELPNIGFCNNGICSSIGRNRATYNDMINHLFNIIFCYFISDFILKNPEFSEETKNKVEKFVGRDFKINARYLSPDSSYYFYNYYYLNKEEKNLVKNAIRIYMENDSNKRKIIDYFMRWLRCAYNINNGFPRDYKSNIAFESWYVNEKIDEYEKNRGETNKRR